MFRPLNFGHRGRLAALVCVLTAIAATVSLRAEDWPQFHGPGRLNIWKETGILEKFPEGGLKPSWRTPINGGYASASVANGRVFVTDAGHLKTTHFLERVIALDEQTGKILWTSEVQSDYAEMVATWAVGPVATPTVDGDRVYALLRMGNLLALDAKDGHVLWKKDFIKEFGAIVPLYGWTGAPLIDGDRLICLVGGEGNAKVIAFNKMTGDVIWQSLETKGEPGYNSPIIIEAAGVRQLIIWHPTAVSSLDPLTGKVHWEFPFVVEMNLTVATPAQSGPYLFITTQYTGVRLLKIDETKPDATPTLVWSTNSGEDLINPWSSSPIIDGDYVYGFNSFGMLRCVELKTGKLVWETQAVTKEHALWSTAFPVRHQDHYFITNDRGELIIAKFTPAGYEEFSRTKVITPTHAQPRRREFEFVNWSEAAYANKHIIVRNNNEIVRYSLAKE